MVFSHPARLLAISLLLVSFLACRPTPTIETEPVEAVDDMGYTEQYTRRVDNFAREGTYLRYDPKGILVEEANYINDTLDGVRILYTEAGDTMIKEHYVKGVFHGPYMAYHENGQVELVGTYTDGVMSGRWQKYYPSGARMEIVTMANNAENGPFTEWHENGQLKAEGQYLDGPKEHGELKLYNTDGVLERRMTCDRGLCQTTWKMDGLE